MQNNKPKVGILTTFHEWKESYSLTGVVKHQLLSLISNGYKPVLFVLESFPKEFNIDKVEIRRVIPQITTEPYHGLAATQTIPHQFEKDVAKIVPAFNEHFKDIDMMLCHDIIFQDSFLPYNAALRKMVMKKHQRFFHWMHSGPSLRPQNMTEPIEFLYTVPKQSRLIYMNNYDVVRAAEMYGTYASEVRVVHNPIDYRTLELKPIVAAIIEKSNLCEADVVGVYPISSTRMNEGGKQLNKAVKVMAGLKKLGLKVRYIIPNAHANGDREKAAIQEVLLYGKSLGLEPMKDLIFTSFINPPNFEQGIDHDAVMQLFQLSDIFLFPSVSENCPLALLEAALTKNLLVLNEDFTPMKDFVGPNALYFKFDSVTTTTRHDNEDQYYLDISKIIFAELSKNRIWKSHKEVRQRFNVDYIFKTQIEPLFFEKEDDSEVELTSENKTAMEDELRKFKEKYGLKL